MNTKDLFQLAVRVLGLVFLFLGVEHLAALFRAPESAYLAILTTTALYLGVAWWLVGGAKWLMTLAYPEANPTPRPPE